MVVSLKNAALPLDGAMGSGGGAAVGRPLHLRGPCQRAAWGLAGAGGVPERLLLRNTFAKVSWGKP